MPSDPARIAAQRYCGWHVSPEEITTVTVDGPGGLLLALPTLKLANILQLTEDGAEIGVTGLEWSASGLVRKKNRASWTSALGGITVMMQHGYDEADDFERAVTMIDATMNSAVRDDPALTNKKIDDVEYGWSVALLTGLGPAAALLDKFRLPGAP